MVDQKTRLKRLPPATREGSLRLAIERFYFAYRAFTAPPDRILQRRGLGRVHHRILYFVGVNPQISVNALLRVLSVTKQALNAPLRQLAEMRLVTIETAEHDRRVRQLRLTPSGARLEAQLTGAQMQQLEKIFAATGTTAEEGWHRVMRQFSAHR
jgi:DNA-binding MarR family transcriptional regulator